MRTARDCQQALRCRLGLPLSPVTPIVTGLQQAAVQTHFAHDFTRRVGYGVLDIPGFD